MFIPNYKLSQLAHLEFDLAINQNSLGEMTTDQVKEYIDFVFKTCSGSFYCHNQDHLEQNLELENLTDMLEKKFHLVEVPSLEKTVASIKSKINKLTNLASMLIGKTNSRQFFYYREYIGTPRK
jgi:polyhydroxyalkanoate synthesis regulator phasin